MKPFRLALLALLLATCTVFSHEIDGPALVRAQHLVKLSVKAIPAKSGTLWSIDPLDGQSPAEIEWGSPRKGAAVAWIAPVGRYRVTMTIITILADGTPDFDIAEKVVTIGAPVPPVPPVPPGPTPPGPNPPAPPVPIDPAPIPTAGLRAFIVFDPKVVIPPDQKAILEGKVFRDLLNAKCTMEPDGVNKGYRIWPSTVDASAETKVWQDAFARPRKALPWILISNGKTGFEGPLPANVADATTLLNKYAATGRK